MYSTHMDCSSLLAVSKGSTSLHGVHTWYLSANPFVIWGPAQGPFIQQSVGLLIQRSGF